MRENINPNPANPERTSLRANRAKGLYDPAHEHDSCGVGFVANIKGVKSHKLVQQGVEILVNLHHRGACGCDPETSDGAGLLSQIPDKFFRRVMGEKGVKLPPAGRYGVGMVFLPRDPMSRESIREMIDMIVAREGGRVLGWRDVATNSDALGFLAKENEPHVAQVFIGGFKKSWDADAIERSLYVMRKCISPAVRGSAIVDRDFFYFVSLSTQTIIHKGLMLGINVSKYYEDLNDPDFESAIVLVHQRYSTNTFPSWELAHPYRYLAHNGEINTLRGNSNWMSAREHQFKSELFGADIEKVKPIIMEGASDSAAFDNVLELLIRTGRSLPHAVMMMIPEAWENHDTMPADKKAFYEYHSAIMEPWDGPASIAFTDGRMIGAVLDRNGLRPSRYWVTEDEQVIMASESGVLNIPDSKIITKGRLQPGRMFLVDTEQGRIIPDHEIKSGMAARQPYAQWLEQNQKTLSDLPEPEMGAVPEAFDADELTRQLQAFGYTLEDLKIIVGPMAQSGEEPIGSMGNDVPLAVFSDRPQLLYSYFRQLFAQVTNPPLDGIREELVTALRSNIGAEEGLFTETPNHCRILALKQPILTDEDMAKIKSLNQPGLKTVTFSMLFPTGSGEEGLRDAMENLCQQASQAIADGATILVLSDRGVDQHQTPIPALLACAGVHHHLVRQGTRTKCGIVIESAEPREVHHFALLIGYGAAGVNPYLAMQVTQDMVRRKVLPADVTAEKAIQKYIKAINKGLLKIMSKMGISTVASYRGAQIFEAVGIANEVIHRYFTWTASRIEGIGMEVIAEEAHRRHVRGFPPRHIPAELTLDNGGLYQWRRDGEYHYYNPETVAKLQQAVRVEKPEQGRGAYNEYAQKINEPGRAVSLRNLLEFKKLDKPIPLEEVEPASEIVKRFATGAMSFGSISAEAHENLAIAMNRIGGKSNTGEGGEDPARFVRDEKGDLRNSAIKQVASGRFGVTSHYLVNAQDLQIKMAQGAKPGEGGQLPGHKVSEWIARVRHSTPGVGLISPPPHHDIYSIEDLAQLIHDLKNANRDARIHVKLVSEVGVGTVAAGVAKGKSDVVLISGDSGGTGASPQTSIRHGGLPWELGLAETHQVLVKNRLRGRIVVQTDGQLKTGRDVAIACLLGAEEFGFATAPLIATGCIMMRKCHLNTCPVGVATQDPELRKKFAGTPENVINFCFLVAEELREIMASLGFRTIAEMVGRVDKLNAKRAVSHWKAKGVDLSLLLEEPEAPADEPRHCVEKQDHGLEHSLDMTKLLEICRPAIERGEKVKAELPIRNINRTVGTITGSEITKKWGGDGLPEDTVEIKFHGSAGQSFAAFTPKGMTFIIEGDANDYFGKGLSGSKVVVYPSAKSKFVPEENIIIGNVAFYGATSGEAYIRGLGGERFCVRNSGVHAVIEGVGDHGCEYMTGGRVVVLGSTGRNFAAGMSGGIAYVLDEDGTFPIRCNKEMVNLERIESDAEIKSVRAMIERHAKLTGSTVAKRVLDNWKATLPKFVKIMPHDYKRVLMQWAKEDNNGKAELARALVGAGANG